MTTSNPIQILLNSSSESKMVDINIIKSPMKYEILELLRNSEMNFEEIVKNTSKSKGAVSMHLKGLREEGIVSYRPDPKDNRKKIFYLNSDVIGNIDSTKSVKSDQTQKMIEKFIEKGDMEYAVMLVHIFKSVFLEYGIEIDNIVKKIGNHLGEYIFREVCDENLDTFMENIAEYWADNNLGFLTFDVENKIEITCRDCFESRDTPKTGKPTCFLERGMFEKLFEKFFGFKVNVCEIRCYSMGDDECLFEIEP